MPARLALLCAVLAAAAAARADAPAPPALWVPLGGESFRLELALDPETRQLGLSGRPRIAANEGMLFVFPAPRPLAMVMRDCPVPIDVAFLDAAGVGGLDDQLAGQRPRLRDGHADPDAPVPGRPRAGDHGGVRVEGGDGEGAPAAPVPAAPPAFVWTEAAGWLAAPVPAELPALETICVVASCAAPVASASSASASVATAVETVASYA